MKDRESLRVLMMNPAFSGGGYMHNLCNALTDAGCNVDLYTGPHFMRASRGWARVDYQPRIHFYRLTQMRSYQRGVLRPFWRGARLVGYVWAMGRVVQRAGSYDVVHAHFPPLPGLDVMWFRAIRRRTRLVLTVHNLYPHDAQPSPGLRGRLLRLYQACDALVGHAECTVRGLLDEFGLPSDRVVKIPMGNASHLLTMRGVPRPEKIGLDRGGPPIVLLLGEVRHNKGPDVLLRAAALLQDAGKRFKVVVAGMPGVAPAPYIALARTLGLGKVVEFHIRYLEEEEVTAYLNAATVVALPYRTIDQSLVAISATSMGRALVASSVGGLSELVREAGNGILVPPDDPASLAAGLGRMLDDPGFRAHCERNSLRYAADALDWAPLAERLITVYRGHLGTGTV